ncbi:MAG: 16S rRNA (guanine(966)-N(2))-methyltransferase RsmD [Ruminococcaceae bacterium]|nr:16S rRNA (guanine(966)-N(2))-methyltransferase RsmD [Oscillospiraceae bacterium]
MDPVLRIITGKAKGKRIETLEGELTRPTSERIKEAVFSAIQFDIENRRVLDLFAGSGQLGLEALSRGAASVSFVDSAREAMEVVKKNAKATGFFEDCRYVVSDWRNYIRKASGRDKYDLVFIDPPYSMECCADALVRLSESGLLEKGAILVLESGTEEIDVLSLSNFEVIKSTHYGKKTFVNILLYRGSAE